MKAVKIVLGTLASAYTLLALLRLVEVLTVGGGGERGQINLVASIVPAAVGGAIALSLLQSAFKKPPAAEEER